MSKAPAGVDQAQLNIAARRVLLDAVGALQGQRDAVIVVGAQAVHLRTDDEDLTEATFTSDADLGLDPRALSDLPRIEVAIRDAGFDRGARPQPGQWWRTEDIDGVPVPIEVDLLVPESFSVGKRRRNAEIPPHETGAARKVAGLEPALVDNDPMLIRSLEPAADRRSVPVQAAGAAALLVAKPYKINDRAQQAPGRLTDKDAADVVRLMQTSIPSAVAATFSRLMSDPDVGGVSRKGVEFLTAQFGSRRALGVDMAARALTGVVPERTIRALGPAFIKALGLATTVG